MSETSPYEFKQMKGREVVDNMTNRENFLSLIKRQGYERVPVDFSLCPSLKEKYHQEEKTDVPYREYFSFPYEDIWQEAAFYSPDTYLKYYKQPFEKETSIDMWGIAYEKGSDAAMHMRRMLHPLENAVCVDDILNYPLPDFSAADIDRMRADCDALKNRDKICCGDMQMTIWEISWYLRGMENLMMDMMCEEEMADALLDRVTKIEETRARNYARAGVDFIYLGDDIGMQHSIMMSVELYKKYLQPRLASVIRAAREVKPDILVFYHSCGYVTPFIPLLIEAGVDVLNPVQPECMDFAEIHALYGDRLSFCGTIGTQTTFPFGTPEDVKKVVKKNLDIAGKKGGLLVSPTHLLEPEVPWENVKAYIEACEEYTAYLAEETAAANQRKS